MANKPVRYTAKLAAEILERIAAGESLRAICREEGMPAHQSVLRWALEDRQGFREKYDAAMDIRAACLLDEILDIADTPVNGEEITVKPTGTETKTGDMLGHRRLQVDARKWYLSKLFPKRFGERITQEISGPDGGPIKTETQDAALQEFTAVKDFVEDLRKKIQDPELRAEIIKNLPGRAKGEAETIERIAGIRAQLIAERMENGFNAAAKVQPPASFRGEEFEE